MPTPNRPPRLTVVLLTWNEERNIAACLQSLAAQREQDFEVVVVDAASTDATAAIVRDAIKHFPVPLRLDVAATRIPIGEARNRGVALAKAPIVAFLSADCEADPHWVEEALQSLRSCDMAFGRQIHAPHAWTVGAAVRGMRYHFPRGPAADPLRYASNVAAAYRKEILKAYPFDAWANAAEDLLLARRAHEAGYHATYNPDMVVRHHDVATSREEMRKNLREGEGWGMYRADLGLFLPVLAWGALLALALLLLVLSPGPETLLVLLAALWFPAVRRALKHARDMPPKALALGLAASPAFDVAFLITYLRGLLGGKAARSDLPRPKELQG
jgi:glycosyltransferase involved in cell wall biosynthesis